MSPNKTVPQQRFFPDDLVHLFYRHCVSVSCVPAASVGESFVVRPMCLYGGEERRSSPRYFFTVHRMSFVYQRSEERLYCYNACFSCVSFHLSKSPSARGGLI